MPIVKRKPVQLQEPSPALLDAYTQRHEDRAVFFLAATGEIFEEYEYVAPHLRPGNTQRASATTTSASSSVR